MIDLVFAKTNVGKNVDGPLEVPVQAFQYISVEFPVEEAHAAQSKHAELVLLRDKFDHEFLVLLDDRPLRTQCTLNHVVELLLDRNGVGIKVNMQLDVFVYRLELHLVLEFKVGFKFLWRLVDDLGQR